MTMDESEMTLYLRDSRFERRDEILDLLRKKVRRDHGRSFLFDDPAAVFEGLASALTDASWETRYQCIKVIEELVPQLGGYLDESMQPVLPHLVSLLGDSKVTLSDEAGHALNRYAKYTHDFQIIVRTLISHGLEAKDVRTRKAVIRNVSFLFTDDHKTRNFEALVESLIRRLCDKSLMDGETPDLVSYALAKITDLVGQERFDDYVERIPDYLKKRYYRLVNNPDERDDGESDRLKSSVREEEEEDGEDIWRSLPSKPAKSRFANGLGSYGSDENENFVFGVIPDKLIVQSNEKNDPADQVKAMEEMKRIVSDPIRLNSLLPHAGAFLDFLKKTLDEKLNINAKVVISLELIEILVERLGVSVKYHVKQVVSALMKQMPDVKPSVRSLIMRVSMRLMQTLPPKTVLPHLFENLFYKNVHVRQQTLNVIIAALLTHPSSDFDLGKLCQAIVHTLVDAKKQVRQASLECFAVIAQSMGSGKQQQLITVVDSLEQNSDADGVMAAVQARLARRQLPMLVDGVVEYATQVPTAGNRTSDVAVDIEWILEGTIGSSFPSSRSSRSEAFSSESPAATRRHGPMSSSKIWTKFSSENPQQDNFATERVSKSGNVQHSSEIRKQLRHFNSAQFPLRGSEYSPERSRFESDDRFIPTKPMPVRGPSSKKSVPPRQQLPEIETKNYENGDQKKDVHLTDRLKETVDMPETQEEMNNSLKQIRNSASKKQLNKLFLNEDSSQDWTTTNKLSQDSQKELRNNSENGKFDVAFELNSHPVPRRNDHLPHVGHSSDSLLGPIDFNPWSGVTFRENPTSDVAVVGRGYRGGGVDDDDAVISAASHRQSPFASQKKNADKQRLTKGIPIYGSQSIDDFRTTGAVVGKAALNPMTSSSQVCTLENISHSFPDQNDGDDRPIRGTGASGLPSAVYGNTFTGNKYYSDQFTQDGNTNNENSKKIGREKYDQRSKVKELENNHRFIKPRQLNRINSNEKRRRQLEEEKEEGKKIEDEDEDEEEAYRRINSSTTTDTGFEDGQTVESSNYLFKRKLKQKKRKPLQIETRLPNYKKDNDAIDDNVSTSMILNPSHSLNEALRYLAQEDWEDKMHGLDVICQLSSNHQNTLCMELSKVLIFISAEVKNLRSKVSGKAMVCLYDMFMNLKKNMDADLDKTVGVLLLKTGESNSFIRENAEKALIAMVDNVTSQKAVNALIVTGASNRNSYIRTVTGQMLERLVERLGPEKVFSGNKDIADKLLPASAQFLQDATPEVRYTGQKIFHLLMFYPDFDRMLKKHISETLLRNIQDKLEMLRQKGPTDSGQIGSSRQRKIPPENKASKRGSSAPTVTDDSLPPVNVSSSISRKKASASSAVIDDTAMSDIQSIETLLSSSDWRQRCNGVEQLQYFTENNPNALSAFSITKIFSKYVPCLHDSNSKLNLYALQVLHRMTPLVSASLATSSILNLTIQTVVSNLASKNREIFDVASAVLNDFENHVDSSLLLLPFISEAQKGKGIIKSEMTFRISNLIPKIFSRRSNQLITQTLPFVWHLLSLIVSNTGGSKLRKATAQLVNNIYQLIGNELMSAAKGASNVTSQMQEALQELLENV